MKPSTRSEILRIFGNRYTEAHPFKTGSAGMEYFSTLISLVAQLTRKEVDEFLVPMIDGLLEYTQNCHPCHLKLLVYGELFCSQKSVKHSIRYWTKYQALLRKRRKGKKERDFRTETYRSIHMYGELGIRG